MGTRGNYAVIKDDKYYAVYNHSDMYPSGYPFNLLWEAAGITEAGDWDEVVSGWTQTEWLDWFEADERENGDVNDRAKPEGPSWRAAAEMPSLEKDRLGVSDREWGVVMDADNEEIILYDSWHGGYGQKPVVVAAVDMNDAEALRGLALSFRNDDPGSGELSPVATRRGLEFTASQERLPHSGNPDRWEPNVADGAWKRPQGYKPFDGDPNPATWQTQQAIGGLQPSGGGATPRCRHVGVRNGKPCTGPMDHPKGQHRYD